MTDALDVEQPLTLLLIQASQNFELKPRMVLE
jgi:hypothetical protein